VKFRWKIDVVNNELLFLFISAFDLRGFDNWTVVGWRILLFNYDNDGHIVFAEHDYEFETSLVEEDFYGLEHIISLDYDVLRRIPKEQSELEQIYYGSDN